MFVDNILISSKSNKNDIILCLSMILSKVIQPAVQTLYLIIFFNIKWQKSPFSERKLPMKSNSIWRINLWAILIVLYEFTI